MDHEPVTVGVFTGVDAGVMVMAATLGSEADQVIWCGPDSYMGLPARR